MKTIPTLTPEQIERFWAKVDRRGKDDCWEWIASTVRGGYGQFRINGTYYLAHRVAYVISQSEDPGEMHVCHRCDNPACCNPQHFFLGTNLDNHHDKAQKGRSVQGEAQHDAKLTSTDVLKIRASEETQSSLAKRYGVSQPRISQVQIRKAWRHI